MFGAGGWQSVLELSACLAALTRAGPCKFAEAEFARILAQLKSCEFRCKFLPRTLIGRGCLLYMATSQGTTTSTQTTAAVESATLAKCLAPEDIRPGDYVTPLSMLAEVPSYWWCADDWSLPRDRPVCIRFITNCDGAPLRVKSICLPFVLVKQPSGQSLTLDLRKCQLARLDRKYARRAWKAYKNAARTRNANSQCRGL
jgi:hypothetical protein